MHAIVLERNKLVNRRIARVLGCAGYQPCAFEEPETVDLAALDAATLLLADAFDVEQVVKWMRERPQLKVVLYSGEPLDRLLGKALEEPRIEGLLGRASFEAPPREDDLLHVARRARGGDPAPFEWHLAWGAAGFERALADTAGRDQAVKDVLDFTSGIGAPKRVAEMLGELAHELIMNAIYDAPTDDAGRPLHAHDRKAEIRLAGRDAARLRCGSDGVRIALEVTDRFGRLTREHVFGGLTRGLKSGQMDTEGGGAGLGMLVCYRSTTALFYDVDPGRRTRVTGLFDLDLNLREFRQMPKTIHFPEGA